MPLIKEDIANGELFWAHAFELACSRNDIDHRTTKVKPHITTTSLRRLYYESHEQLRRHLAGFISAYNFGRRLKTLKGLTPYEFICKAWASNPERFSINPLQQMPGLNI